MFTIDVRASILVFLKITDKTKNPLVWAQLLLLVLIVTFLCYQWNYLAHASGMVGDNPFGDAWLWWRNALLLADGVLRAPASDASRPGFALILGPWAVWGGTSFFVVHKILIFLFFWVVTSLAYLWSSRYGKWSAIFFVLFALFNPHYRSHLATSNTEGLGFIFCILHFLYFLWALLEQENRRRHLFLSGLFLGIALVSRPLLIPLPLLCMILLFRMERWRNWPAFLLPLCFVFFFVAGVQRLSTGLWTVSSNDGSILYAASDPRIGSWNGQIYLTAEEQAKIRLAKNVISKNELNEQFKLMAIQNFKTHWRFHLLKIPHQIYAYISINLRGIGDPLGIHWGFVLIVFIAAIIHLFKGRFETIECYLIGMILVGIVSLSLIGGISTNPDRYYSKMNGLGSRVGTQFEFCFWLLCSLAFRNSNPKISASLKECSLFKYPWKLLPKAAVGLWVLGAITIGARAWNLHDESPQPVPQTEYQLNSPTEIRNQLSELRAGHKKQSVVWHQFGSITPFIWNLPEQRTSLVYWDHRPTLGSTPWSVMSLMIEFPQHLVQKDWENRLGLLTTVVEKDAVFDIGEFCFYKDASALRFIPYNKTTNGFDYEKTIYFDRRISLMQLHATGAMTSKAPHEWSALSYGHACTRDLIFNKTESKDIEFSLDLQNRYATSLDFMAIKPLKIRYEIYNKKKQVQRGESLVSRELQILIPEHATLMKMYVSSLGEEKAILRHPTLVTNESRRLHLMAK